LSELPPYPDGWTVYQQIDYSTSDIEGIYQQDIVIHRTTGTAYNETANGLETWHLYVGSQCRDDYGDIRFTDANGAELAYYLWPDYDSSSARFCVRLAGADVAGGLLVWYGNPSATTTSTTGAWVAYHGAASATFNDTPAVVFSQMRYDARVKYTSGGYNLLFGLADAPISSSHDTVHIQLFTNNIYLYSKNNNVGDSVSIPYSLSLDTWYDISILHNGTTVSGYINGTKIGDWSTNLPDAELGLTYWAAAPAGSQAYSLVRAYSATPPAATAFSGAMVPIPTLPISATKTYSGTIPHIAAPTTGNWFAVSTTSNLYLQQVTSPTALGTTTTAARTGASYDLALSNDAAFYVEGRTNLIDIFRTDGAQVGTYTAGSVVRHVAIAQANGLYAAGGSDDGKYYVFSKDASSSWYLLHASDSASPVTALAMSWRGETLVIGRSDGHLIAFKPAVEEEEFPGTIRLTVYKDALPYTGARLVIEHGGTDQTWETATAIQTDDYGVATAQVRWGEYVRVTVGENELQRVILPNPQQTEYAFRIKGPDPLRTGAQYSSGYDPDTQRIYLHYDDTREKTHLVRYEIIRSVDNTVVFQREYTALPVNDYYQIPAGWTNSSYRVQLTASGSPSFTNTWSQWVGADGVASLPADLDTYAKMGISFFLILFVAGLFSYITGPQGAVVVSLFAGALVLWGWLPLSPTVVALCIVWAFLGLLGRTSGE